MRRRKSWHLFLKTIFSIFFLSLVAAIFFFSFRSDFFTIKRVTCFVGETACPGDYWVNLLSFSLGRNIFLANSQAISQAMKDAFPDINEVRIKRMFPDQLALTVQLRKAATAINQQNLAKEELATASAEFFIADEEGFIFKKQASSLDLPIILANSFEELKVGQKISHQALLQSITLVSLLVKLDLKPEFVSLAKEGIVFWLRDGPEVFFSEEKKATTQVGSLQLIFSRAKIEGKSLKRVDLRFDKPVIVEK